MRIKSGLIRIAILLVVAVVPLMAVTNGQPDGNRHPYVGVAIQFIPSMPGSVFVCSGSALSATRFLTAAHCFDPALPVFVSYKNGPLFSLALDFTSGAFHPHPDWCLACAPGLPGFDTRDVAVVALNAPSDPGAFAMLPAPGLVDTLEMGTGVDIVGYGGPGIFARRRPARGDISLHPVFRAKPVDRQQPHA